MPPEGRKIRRNSHLVAGAVGRFLLLICSVPMHKLFVSLAQTF